MVPTCRKVTVVCVTMPGNSYWEEDPIMKNVTDNAIINLGEYISSYKDSNDG